MYFHNIPQSNLALLPVVASRFAENRRTTSALRILTGITHAQCWAHSRRKVFDCRDVEPAHADLALDYIGALYAVDAQIREKKLTGDAKCDYLQRHAKPVLNRFFNWIDQQFDKHGFLPSSPFLSALAYIRERRVGLSVYLDGPDVAIDTNHLERALRVISMGKNELAFLLDRAWRQACGYCAKSDCDMSHA